MPHITRNTGDFVAASLGSVMIAGLIYIGVVMLNTSDILPSNPVIEGAIRIAQAQKNDPVEPHERKKLKEPKAPKQLQKSSSSHSNRQNTAKPRMSISTPDFNAEMYPGMKSGISIPKMDLEGVGFEMDEVDEMPHVVRGISPEYPYGAKRKLIEGEVMVRMLVNSKGHPVNLSIYSAKPSGIFEQAALKAAKRWRFKPGRYNGEDVDTWVLLPFKFELTR
ncbi:energy transducer TonB [Desulfovibrio sp. UCD-KL4C]|uniref:energy transducer TonB n=1 Tax=Desulfovibrio sp. UCD-KL4C TaxID=2578120 RepID=UPI0025B9A625|nr:energy transducer TonB [Desulfovibrio sp. UCD-KL4C]